MNLVFTEPKVEQTSSEGDSELSSHSIPYHTGQFASTNMLSMYQQISSMEQSKQIRVKYLYHR